VTRDEANMRGVIAGEGWRIALVHADVSAFVLGGVSPEACFWRSVAFRCEKEFDRCARSFAWHLRESRQ
jgi:hypothetical protein